MITLPSFFSDGMVIGKRARIWGTTEPDSKVTLLILGESIEIISDENGRFEFNLTFSEYGGPHTMRINDHVINDVYIGRLWLCCGQSNMDWPLSYVKPLLGEHIKEDPRIRVFQAERGMKFDGPARSVNGQWHTMTGDALRHSYAVPYFFARGLLEDGDVPVGLFNVAMGGTSVEAWLPEEIVRNYPDLYERLETVRAPGYIERLQKSYEDNAREWNEKLIFDDNGKPFSSRVLLDDTGLTHGAAEYRKTIRLDTLPPSPVTLDLGMAVNRVTAYINGIEIQSVDNSGQYLPGMCVLPEGTLREGENEILLRLIGNAQKPKFIPNKKYALSFPGGSIDLSGYWQCRASEEMPPLEGSPWFYTHPCCVYNYMLAPVLGIQPDGVIFYQGESNVGAPHTYKELFSHFVELLRKRCGENLPVIFTQLASYLDVNCSVEVSEIWPKLREAQRQCLSIPNTAMAVAIDCGEEYDIHPLNKKTVGERLALHARKMVYGNDIPANGPVISRVTQDGDRFTLRFDNAQGLWAKGGRPLIELVYFDGEAHRLYATVESQTLVADAAGSRGAVKVPQVERVRFGWSDYPSVTLYNAHNLPAPPFEMEVSHD
ncbi:MAG: sialate O-acetylesterase [Defluviitaleaceae bacterium]|nr:sialate O-acetylesterase [Defluviitaleaceae bacterium]